MVYTAFCTHLHFLKNCCIQFLGRTCHLRKGHTIKTTLKNLELTVYWEGGEPKRSDYSNLNLAVVGIFIFLTGLHPANRNNKIVHQFLHLPIV